MMDFFRDASRLAPQEQNIVPQEAKIRVGGAPPGRQQHEPAWLISKVLEDLFRQVDRNEGEFIKEINILRDKFISDSETIKMGLTQLMNSEQHRETISSEKATHLKQIADLNMEPEDTKLDDLSKLQAREKYLGELEREIIGILSQHFKK